MERYRLYEWHNVRTGTSCWGIQCQMEPCQRYKHLSIPWRNLKRAAIYTEKSIAQKHIDALNSGLSPNLKKGLEPLRTKKG